MPDVPRYPGNPRDGAPEPDIDPESKPASRRSTYAWWIFGAGLVVLFIVLHLAGVFGPGSH